MRLGPSYSFILVHPNGATMERLVAMMAAGKLRVVVDRTFPLKSARCAPLLQRRTELWAVLRPGLTYPGASAAQLLRHLSVDCT